MFYIPIAVTLFMPLIFWFWSQKLCILQFTVWTWAQMHLLPQKLMLKLLTCLMNNGDLSGKKKDTLVIQSDSGVYNLTGIYPLSCTSLCTLHYAFFK